MNGCILAGESAFGFSPDSPRPSWAPAGRPQRAMKTPLGGSQRRFPKRVIGIEPTTFSLGTPQAADPKRVSEAIAEGSGLEAMRVLRRFRPMCGRRAV